MNIQIKPLEWMDCARGLWAQSIVGDYRIDFDPPRYYVVGPTFGANKGSVDAAKAAAQTDYETRILSALISSPGKDGGQEVEADEPVAWRYSFDEGITWNHGGEKPGKHRFGGPDIVQPLYTRPQPASTALVERPQVLKGVGKINGDGWKDTTKVGEVVFVWNEELPPPYKPGQFPRIGCEHYTASTDQYDFTPASISDIRAYLNAAKEGFQS